jgi:hypothetical protein
MLRKGGVRMWNGFSWLCVSRIAGFSEHDSEVFIKGGIIYPLGNCEMFKQDRAVCSWCFRLLYRRMQIRSAEHNRQASTDIHASASFTSEASPLHPPPLPAPRGKLDGPQNVIGHGGVKKKFFSRESNPSHRASIIRKVRVAPKTWINFRWDIQSWCMNTQTNKQTYRQSELFFQTMFYWPKHAPCFGFSMKP